MLHKLELHNFKSHHSTRFQFDRSRLHALIGANSSGKTSVLQAIDYLSRLTNQSFDKVFSNGKNIDIIANDISEEISVELMGSWAGKSWLAAYKFLPVQSQKSEQVWGPAIIWNADLGTRTVEKTGGWNTGLHSTEQPIVEMLKDVAYVKLGAANLSKAAYSDAITPQLKHNGDSLAPALDYLQGEYPDIFQNLQQNLQRVVPGVRKLRVRRAKVTVPRQRLIQVDKKSISYDDSQEIMGQEVLLDMDTGDRIPAHAISEGTMLALGLLTILMQPSQPNLVLLDDVEQGLHPKAQRELMSVFKEIIHENPNLQIIFSTHSPYIVDALTPSQVHVLSVDSSGMTQTKRLDEHPDVEWAKQTLTTGEFWDAEGEDWVITG